MLVAVSPRKGGGISRNAAWRLWDGGVLPKDGWRWMAKDRGSWPRVDVGVLPRDGGSLFQRWPSPKLLQEGSPSKPWL